MLVGGVTVIIVTFKNEAGELADPDTVTARVVPPSGAPVNYAPAADTAFVRASIARYVLRVSRELAGSYKWRVKGTSVDIVTGVNASVKGAFQSESDDIG